MRTANQKRPEEAVLSVSVGVLLVRCALGEAQADEEEDLIGRIRDRVGTLGEHGRAAGDKTGYELGDRDEEVGDERRVDRLLCSRFCTVCPLVRRHALTSLRDCPSLWSVLLT